MHPLEDRHVPATILVTNILDDTVPGNGVSLREAIESINNGGDFNSDVAATGYGTDDQIIFSPGAYGTISLANGELTIAAAVVIDGPGVAGGAFPIQVDGKNATRLFNIDAAGSIVLIDGLYLTNGSVSGGSGGAVLLHNGDLNIQSCLFSNNSASSDGGAIAALDGELTVSSTGIEGSVGGNAGGAIYSEVPTTVTDSTFTHNKAPFGGALEVATSSGSLQMSNCLISNSGDFPAGDEGGGIRLRDVSTTTKSSIVDVQFDECYVNDRGGALAFVGSGDIELIGTGSRVYAPMIGSGGATQTGGMGGAIYIAAFNSNSPTVLISGYEMGADADGHGNFADYGGNIAIVNVATDVTVLDCDIDNGGNHGGHPWSVLGGNVYITGQSGGSIVFTRNIIRDGRAEAGAGVAIANSSATIIFDQCFIHHNSSQSSHGGGFLIDSVPLITIKNSTLSENNAAAGFGGGVYELFQPHGRANITQCTIFGNSAIRGGGIYGQGADSAWLVVSNSTIAGNTAQGGDPASINTESQGGGIWFHDYDNFELKSTIVATNMAVAGVTAGGPDIHGGKLTAHYSLIGVDDGFTPDSPASNYFDNNQLGTVGTPLDPGFQPDSFNNLLSDQWGGATQVIALASNSKAIDHGHNSLDLTYDQRGASFWRVVGDAPDIGSYESEPTGWQSAQVAEIRLNADITQPPGCENSHSRILNVRITFSMVVALPNQLAIESAFQIERSSDGAHPPFTATVTTGGSATVVTLTFPDSGTAIQHHSLADGRYSLMVFADKISAGNFDGNGNGTPQGTSTDDYVLAAPTGSAPFTVPSGGNLAGANLSFFRYYGDADGNGLVGLSDFTLFGGLFNLGSGPGNGNTVFDFDNDLNVSLSDLSEFRNHFNFAV